MNKYQYLTILVPLVLVFVFFLWRRYSSTSRDPQPAYCGDGSVSVHPASEQATKILESALAKDNGTGISAAVVLDGELVFAGAVGQAGRRLLLGSNARMRTGSVAKLFTAAAAARLVEINLLDLDAPIAAIVPESPNGKITCFQLGTHTSGIRHYNFQKLAEANNQKHYPSLSDALECFIADPLLAEPGTKFHYSSFGFNLLGVVVERVYGAPYDVVLHDLVAAPLGLSSLRIDDAKTQIPCRPVFSTIVFGQLRMNAPRRDNSDLYPSGGLLVSARDLAVFTDAIFNGGFLQPETLKIITTPVTTPDGTPTGYSFGWQVGRSADGKMEWYGHGGEINGAYASVRYYPASRLTVVGMANYNHWLTSVEPEFFHAVRKEIPALFITAP